MLEETIPMSKIGFVVDKKILDMSLIANGVAAEAIRKELNDLVFKLDLRKCTLRLPRFSRTRLWIRKSLKKDGGVELRVAYHLPLYFSLLMERCYCLFLLLCLLWWLMFLAYAR